MGEDDQMKEGEKWLFTKKNNNRGGILNVLNTQLKQDYYVFAIR